MFKLLGFICFVVAIAGVVAYTAGWVQFETQNDKTTIELETQKIKDATGKAIEGGKKAVESIKQSFNGSESNDSSEGKQDASKTEPETNGND